MQCPYLSEGEYILCTAGDTPYSPNTFVIMKYCSGISKRRCAFLQEIIRADFIGNSITDLEMEAKL